MSSETMQSKLLKNKKEADKIKNLLFEKFFQESILQQLTENEFKIIVTFLTVLELSDEEKEIILQKIISNKNFYEYYVNAIFKNITTDNDISLELNLKLDILIKKFYKTISI